MNIERFDIKSDPFDMGVELPVGELTVQCENALKKYAIGKEYAVELGTYKGRASAILSLFAESVVTVDEFPTHKPADYETVKKDLDRFPNVLVIRDLSNLSAKHFIDNSINLLVQDAGHSADNVVDDIKAYLPKLKDKAIIMIHDYKYMDGRQEDLNVQGGVNILLECGIIEEVEQMGWYFIARKK